MFPAADPGPRIGVVGIELSLRTVSEQMLTIEGLSQTTVPMLLNNEGVIKILGEGAEDEEARLALEGTYPNQRVLRALRNGHSGYELDNRNDRVAFYTTLDVSGWHYIVEGQASELIPRLDH